MNNLEKQDREVYKIIKNEEKRQQEGLELIASENYASSAVLEAMANVFNNKYSEGMPYRRYYGGQEFVDQIENLAIKRAKSLFIPKNQWGNWHVNVQPYSGSPANAAVYFALLEFGDKALGMALNFGGHLTHGHPKVTYSGRAYNFVQYRVSEKTERLDYGEILKLAQKEKPKLIVCGASAYPRIIDFKKFREISDKVDAYLIADISHIAGLVVSGLHPSPIPFADVVTTTTHKTLRGPRGAIIICKKELAPKIDKAIFPGFQGGPHDHVTCAKAVAFAEALKPEFKQYSKQVIKNAQILAQELINYGYNLVTQGTDNHLILLDLTRKKITGKEAEVALDKIGITVNKNMVPYDLRSPFDPSGIRIGTPAATTRGMKKVEMKKIAKWINEAIENRNNNDYLIKLKKEVQSFCKNFPVPGKI